MAANAALLALKAQREAQQRAEEEAFRAAMMAKFAEDDRIEQFNEQKRRLTVRAAHSFSTVHRVTVVFGSFKAYMSYSFLSPCRKMWSWVP